MKLNKIATVPALTLISALAGATPAAADGFAPWDDRGVLLTPDALQAEVAVGPYYEAGLPAIADRPDAIQAEVNVGAWYAPARGLPESRTAVIELAAE